MLGITSYLTQVSYTFTIKSKFLLIASPLVNNASETPKIVITFPSSIALASTCTFSSTAGALSSSLTCTATNAGADRRYEITNPFGGSGYTSSGTNLEITVGLVTNPAVSGNPGTFTVSTYLTVSANDYLVDTGTFSTVSISPGTLTSPALSSSSTVAYASSSRYTVDFTTQHQVIVNGVVDVVFPSTIIISDSSAAVAGCRAALGTAALSAAACTFVSSTQIKFTNLFSTAFTGAVKLEIPGIRNPRSKGVSSSLTISTTNSAGTVIDTQNSGFTVNMLSVEELQAVSVQNTRTEKVNGVFDPYKVIVTAQTPTHNGDKVILQFPTSMTFPSSAGSLSCAAGTNIVAISCTMTSASYIITATITTFTGGSVSTGAQFDFTINTLGNPISLAPYNMQSIKLVDSADSDVNTYAAASTLVIQNNKAGALTGQSLSQSTDIAGASAVYTFRFTPTNAIPQHAKIELIYPSTVTVPTSITCTGLGGIPSGRVLDCTTSHNTGSRTLTILNGFNTTTSVTTQVTFQIDGIKNPTSSSTSSFTLSTLTNADFRIDTIDSGLVPQLQCNFPCKT